MNIAIAEACSSASDAEKGKIEIRPAIPFVPESAVESERTEKNKDDFIAVTCRYRPRVSYWYCCTKGGHRGIPQDDFGQVQGPGVQGLCSETPG